MPSSGHFLNACVMAVGEKKKSPDEEIERSKFFHEMSFSTSTKK